MSILRVLSSACAGDLMQGQSCMTAKATHACTIVMKRARAIPSGVRWEKRLNNVARDCRKTIILRTFEKGLRTSLARLFSFHCAPPP